LQEKNKDLIDKLDERIKSLENNIGDNKINRTNSNLKEYSSGIRTLVELILGFLIGGFLGYYLDIILYSSPICMLLGVFLGGISGIYTIWKKNIYDDKQK
jgi:F0F1-type ATP synthase assembly protein I